MRITHLCLAGTITDGWSYQENLLSKYHSKLGHEVSIITSRWVYNDENKLYKYPESDYYTDDGIHVIRLEISNKDDLTYKFKRYNGIEEALKMTKPEILFIHGCQFLDMSKVVRYIKINEDLRVYVDNHADFSNSATNFVSKIFLHKVLWRHSAQQVLPYVTKFYGVLPSRVEFLRNVYKLPEDKLELLVMGGDDELSECAYNKRNDTRNKYGMNGEDFLIVTGGKIDKWKKQTLLLMDAVKKLGRTNVKILVFGSIDPKLKAQVEALSDGKIVNYIGWINADYSYDLFAAADLVVFPGRHSVFWEQVASQGIPMIVKDWPGTHHIDMGGNVKFLKKDSEEEIRKVLLEIIDNPKKYSLMKECAIYNKKTFSYRDIAIRSIR